MNFENSISLNFPSIMLETLETLKRFKSFMKLYNPMQARSRLRLRGGRRGQKQQHVTNKNFPVHSGIYGKP